MIVNICKLNPIPVEQVGEVKNFKRLNYKDNELKRSFEVYLVNIKRLELLFFYKNTTLHISFTMTIY